MAQDDFSGITLLKKAVEIKSYSGEEREVAELLVREMIARGFRAHIDEAGNAIGELGPDSATKTILFAGHMDTVRGDIPVRIEKDFEGKEVLYGRGSVDAKGPLCAFIEGVGRAAGTARTTSALPPGLKIIIAGCVEEECASSKGARYLIERYKPDMIIIGEPSGTDGITLGYKGRLLMDYSLKMGMAHGASEKAGAGEQAIGFFTGLQGFTAGYNSGIEKSFEQLQLRLRDISTSSDGLQETAEMRLSLRIPPGCDVGEIKRFAEENRGAASLRFSGEELPIKAEKNNALVRTFVRAIRDGGMKPCFRLKTGTSDMNVLGNAFPGVPIIAYGPGDSSLDHTPDEHINIAELEKSIKVIKQILEKM